MFGTTVVLIVLLFILLFSRLTAFFYFILPYRKKIIYYFLTKTKNFTNKTPYIGVSCEKKAVCLENGVQVVQK